MIALSENYDFFEALYPDTADLYLAAHTKGKHLRSAFFAGRVAVDELLAYADANPELDCYYTVCPLESKPDRGRGEARHAGALPCLWLDIDIAGPGHKGSNYPPTLEAALELAYGFPLEPSAIVYTGGGIHAYWLLKPWYLKTNEDQRAAHALSVAFQASFSAPEINPQGYAYDRTADLARILRVPGTQNYKTEPPRPVYVVELCQDKRYTVEQIEAELAKLTPPAESPAPKPERPARATAARGQGRGRGDKWARARAYMSKVEPVPTGGRNLRAYELSCKLSNDFDLGEDGFELLADWNSRNPEPLSDEELGQTFQSALRGAKGARGAALGEDSPEWQARHTATAPRNQKSSDLETEMSQQPNPPELETKTSLSLVADPLQKGLPLLERAVLSIGAICDGATESDGIGFNGQDAGWFAPHIESAQTGVRFADSLRRKIFERLSKYGGQLHGLGFNINQIAAEEASPPTGSRGKANQQDGGDKEPTQVQRLLGYAADWELLRFDGQPYASMVTQNADGNWRRDTLRFSRGGVRRKLLHLYHQDTGGAPSSEALSGAMATLEARAEFEGKAEQVWIRTAHKDGRVYLDLADEEGRVVMVSPAGWEVTHDPPVFFQRTPGMQPLPLPERGGDLAELRNYLNLDDQGFILAVAWVLHAFFPAYPHAILLLEGVQGSGKSSLARFLRSLFDPHSIAFRKAPKDDEDLAICAANNWAVIYDNLGSIPGSISDALCGVATGSGHARRAHYSNDEEAAFSFLRPVLLTGLPGLFGKSDLAERILKVECPIISEDNRLLEAELVGTGDWEEARPRLLGALLDAVACALRNDGKKRLDRLPRMADFVQFVVNAGEALPWTDEEFLEAFQASRSEQVQSMIETCAISTAVNTLAALGPWEGTISDLSERISKLAVNPKDIPPPRILGTRLRNIQANLRAVGVCVGFRKSGSTRYISIRTNTPPEIRGISMSHDVPTPGKPDEKGLIGGTTSKTVDVPRCPDVPFDVPSANGSGTSMSQMGHRNSVVVPPDVPSQNHTQQGLEGNGTTRDNVFPHISGELSPAPNPVSMSRSVMDGVIDSGGPVQAEQPRRKKYCRPEDLADVE